jgi:hypothetical protein
MKKIGALLASRRFWLLGIAALVWGLLQGGVIPEEIANPIILWALSVAGLGTIDKFSRR